ncbi:hypothetical protein LX70_02938 [Defluviimonas denitrificans]|jgi:hypothetical protein|uniref:Uncharacterized protein n=1 Tax=Albidovulum denitrificans TaxID=404881 RepID=A0A2S8S5J1_9RHOB|nr:hypothetical protein [Defluviimonas denitrificans]PQV56053.1 hypothetical protein LX70_02938 [Defluviimonas denitrificans]
MTETPDEKIARLEKRIERLKASMLSNASRPRIITGAVAMDEARRNRDFAATLLAAMDRGQDRMVDRKTITPFIEEVTELWGLQDRPSIAEFA